MTRMRTACRRAAGLVVAVALAASLSLPLGAQAAGT